MLILLRMLIFRAYIYLVSKELSVSALSIWI